MHTIDIFHNRILFTIGSLPVTKTMLTSLGVTMALLGSAVMLRTTVQRRPSSSLAILATIAYEWLETLVSDIVGRTVPWLVTIAGSLFFFIAGCNIAGQFPGLETPAANLATTSALALLVFLAVPIAGIATQGLGAYCKHYLQPNPLLLPLELLSVFGNMMSGHLIVALLVALAGVVVPIPLMALDLLIGLLQAYIFTVLATVYIGAAIRLGGEA
jgi:F-type H+-transporting ATPase subunit a